MGGAVKHGWLLGHKKTPLYGAPTESLAVPSGGWKKFNGAAPVPTVTVHEQLTDVFFALADDAKTAGDAAAEKEDWTAACQAATEGIDALKRSGERFGDPFKNRAALLLSRRATANSKLKEYKAALRDAIAALELVRSLTSAEVVAVEASKALGCKDDAMAQKMLEPVGTGRILDSGAPLVLRCVERWINDAAADKECLDLMHKWEEVFSSNAFQDKRQELWDNKSLSYPSRLRATRSLVADSVTHILEPMGFAPGKPGLSRVVKQMQVYWSADKACANKALDLEELADVSLADLED